jgi:hypothetical protein
MRVGALMAAYLHLETFPDGGSTGRSPMLRAKPIDAGDYEHVTFPQEVEHRLQGQS